MAANNTGILWIMPPSRGLGSIITAVGADRTTARPFITLER